MPAGTDFVQARVTWPSDPDVSIESAVYDSKGNFVSYGETNGGYGHLSFDQISLRGPASQRPVVAENKPWKIAIDPSSGLEPSSPQVVHLSISFMHRVRATSIVLSRKSVTIKPGAVAHVKATVTAPQAAGTSFAGIAVSNSASTSTIPVAVRVPVKLTDGHGAFGGTITGSSVENSGGEFYFYDVKVPVGTASITASLHWPDTGNLVDLYLIDPSGNLRDAKGGDLLWYPDYSSFERARYGLHPHLRAGDLGRAQGRHLAGAGVGGRLQRQLVRRTVQRLDHPRHTCRRASELDGHGPARRAGGRRLHGDERRDHHPVGLRRKPVDGQRRLGPLRRFALAPVTGTLTSDPQAVPPLNGISPTLTFTLPQDVDLVTATATWTGPDTLVDLGLYDSSQTDKADSLASTS